jgi:calcium permeable stress-gated cation channel
MERCHKPSVVLRPVNAESVNAQYVPLGVTHRWIYLTMCIAIGLQYTFKSLLWLTTIPPIIIVMVFKVYINRAYNNKFKYFTSTEDEIRHAHVHSERADNTSDRLSKRFGHPALHADLFTPMLHSSLMPLLSEVYSGRIDRQQTKLNEYGGQKMEAQVIPGGIKIAAIEQVTPFLSL